MARGTTPLKGSLLGDTDEPATNGTREKGHPDQPLADRMRPEDIGLFLGQEHLEKRIRMLLDAPKLPSLLFYGPPGCGKSTLALILARASGRKWLRLSAPEIGIQQLRKALLGVDILVLDELHRFSKAQQDFFLPILESGELTLIATTTENPSFSVTRQLLSRLNLLAMRPLEKETLMELARRGASLVDANIPEPVLAMLVDDAQGDARTLLNLVEYTASLPGHPTEPEIVRQALPDSIRRHDRNGDNHYELASALIKSIRGSDPDAALFYLAALIEGGEDPRFITRRLILSASEDVGLADPHALPLAVSCQQAIEFVGMPEGFIPLAETTVYLALAKKSNSAYSAYLAARRELQQTGPVNVPIHLRNAVTQLDRARGYGADYKYPHSFPDSWVDQEYFPDNVRQRRFYSPTGNGEEPRLGQWWQHLQQQKQASPKREDEV